MLTDIETQPLPRRTADPGADDLNPHHQREREQNGPKHVDAKERSSLRVGRNSTGVIVSRTRNKTRAQLFEQGVFIGGF